jgi:hypothetical protein
MREMKLWSGIVIGEANLVTMAKTCGDPSPVCVGQGRSIRDGTLTASRRMWPVFCRRKGLG